MIMTFKVCQKAIKFLSSILLYKPLICIPCCIINHNLANLKKLLNKDIVARFGLILANKAFKYQFPNSWYSPDF